MMAVATGLGASAASLLSAPKHAQAAAEIMQTAGLDGGSIVFGKAVQVGTS